MLALAALIIALVTLVVGTIMSSRTLTRAADAQFVSNLESELELKGKRIDELEDRVAECERDRVSLREEVRRLGAREIELMRRLIVVEGRVP